MNGGEISGNTAAVSAYGYTGGGGVYVNAGTFTMNGGEISGNSSSSTSNYGGGGGVYLRDGTFSMYDGKISGNTAARDGGGVYVVGGTFSMYDGEISGNTAAYGGGVYAAGGPFTMSGGEISGNTAAASSSGGGVYVGGGRTFAMSGGARINLNNPVYLVTPDSSFITIDGGGLDGSDPAALVQPAPDFVFIGKPALKAAAEFSGTLPVDRFRFSSGWTADAGGILGAAVLPLTASGETAAAYLSEGSVHFYRFTPALYKNYVVTHTGGGTAAMTWADGAGTPVSGSNQLNASRPDMDMLIMVYNGRGAYTVKYEEK
jgi:hypothetical protein